MKMCGESISEDVWGACEDVWGVSEDVWGVSEDVWGVCEDVWGVYQCGCVGSLSVRMCGESVKMCGKLYGTLNIGEIGREQNNDPLEL